MRGLVTITRNSALAAVALSALVLGITAPAAGQEAIIIAQSMVDDPEDLLPPVPMPRERAQPPGEPGPGNPYGVSRRMDPFDRLEDEASARSTAASTGAIGTGATGTGAVGTGATGTGASTGDGQVTCEAGCDGPRGGVVYRKARQPVASLERDRS
jgi:hypothetical protein